MVAKKLDIFLLVQIWQRKQHLLNSKIGIQYGGDVTCALAISLIAHRSSAINSKLQALSLSSVFRYSYSILDDLSTSN